MLTLSGSLRVFLALEPCDMRKSFDGLHAEVLTRLGEDPRLGAQVLAGKYCDQLPFYRQQRIFLRRYGIDFPRNTFCHWTAVSADLCESIYKLIHAGLLQQHSLQADAPPIRYQNPGKGKCSTGYLWVIHAPRHRIKGDTLYQWHPSRKATCLDDLLGDYQGYLQTAAYAAYDSWTAGKNGITLVACWAHARRKFHEAFKAGQTLAAAPLAAKLHLKFSVLRQAACDALITTGSCCERRALREFVKTGETGGGDRYSGLEDGFFGELRKLGASFVIRSRNQARLEIVAELSLTEAGVPPGRPW